MSALRRLCALAPLGLATLVGCGGSQHHTAAAPPPSEITIAATTVRPTDTAAPAPGSASSGDPASSGSPAPAEGTASAQGDAGASAAPSALETAAIQALDARHVAVAECYATTLRTSPDAAGRITVEVVLLPTGHVDRVNVNTEATGGLGNAHVCVSDALRPVTVDGVGSAGLRIHRTYSFVNPPVEVTVADALEITPPRHAAARGRTAPAPAAANTASPAPSDSSGAPGRLPPIDAAAAGTVLDGHRADFEPCYAAVLRTARTAEGEATVVVDVAGDGAVHGATFTPAAPALAGANDCVVAAMRTVRFPASGTPASVHATLRFHR